MLGEALSEGSKLGTTDGNELTLGTSLGTSLGFELGTSLGMSEGEFD